MASDETMTTVISSMQDEEFDDHHHHQQPHNLSRLSTCRSSSVNTNEDDDDDDEGMKMYLSRLSIESFDGDDADEEFSDEKESKGLPEQSSDSDKEPGYYSLPATPPRRRTRRGSISQQSMGVKDYASENEVEKGVLMRQKMRRNLRKRRIMNTHEGVNNNNNNKKEEDDDDDDNNDVGFFSGESDQSGLMVITRPKGGRRSLCMGLEEMKACRDLGFELEHERMLEMPSRVSLSGSTLDNTSSGGNSPIANWRISSPGDDPRDVKARLKVWAQAVALASSTSRQHNNTLT